MRRFFLLPFFPFHGSVHVHAMILRRQQQQLYSLVLVAALFFLSESTSSLSITVLVSNAAQLMPKFYKKMSTDLRRN